MGVCRAVVIDDGAHVGPSIVQGGVADAQDA